jgi:hypothetical protein
MTSLRHPDRWGGSLRWDSKIWPWVLRNLDLDCNCTVNNRLALLSERALQNYKNAAVWRKFQGESKIGCWSQMGAWHQDWLADWLSVVMWLRLQVDKNLTEQDQICKRDVPSPCSTSCLRSCKPWCMMLCDGNAKQINFYLVKQNKKYWQNCNYKAHREYIYFSDYCYLLWT